MTLIGVAGVLGGRGRAEEAARLAGAAVARYDVTPRQLDPQDQQDWDRIVGEIEKQLDEETFAETWEAGRLLSLDEAVSLALAGLQRSAAAR